MAAATCVDHSNSMTAGDVLQMTQSVQTGESGNGRVVASLLRLPVHLPCCLCRPNGAPHTAMCGRHQCLLC
jgi:hypothetical protein